MTNSAWMIVAIRIQTDKTTRREVENDFASYIMPELEKNAPAAVKSIYWVRCESVQDEKGEFLYGSQ